jgi:uncharacterized protein (TIGR02265 family)
MQGGARAAEREQPLAPAALAARAAPSPTDQAVIVRNLAAFPPTVLVRGVFFEGLGRVVAQTRSRTTWAELVRAAGAPEQAVPFRQYPHADFYRLYYLAARVLYPNEPFPTALRRVAREFFPIFKSSMLGRTMTAFMGSELETILPLLAKAYTLSVADNDHRVDLAGARKATWHCRVEPVEWYDQTFAGIVEGAAPPGASLRVISLSRVPRVDGPFEDRVFEIVW